MNLIDLESADPQSIYLNRELTWLDFNSRVLQQANDPHNPLLERLKFLAIVHANLDEFFMKRIGGLKQQIGANLTSLSADGRTPQTQITQAYAKIETLICQMHKIWQTLQNQLKKNHIEITRFAQLNPEQQNTLRQFLSPISIH
ncbi:polyphosphate kinase [Rappaport israeli]|uniref:hypothetical protein n=1 Tax=Rappaport israeli TaxID=1839807 RepID=UPI000A4310AA|nr:hypothetical protein [Rappaport israeli]